MVQAQLGDDRRQRGGDHVGGVQPPAKTHLQHHQVASRLGEVKKGQGRDDFKFRRLVLHRLPHGPPLADQVGKGRVGDLLSPDTEALVEAVQMGRGVQADPIARLGQDGRQAGGNGAFAIGARHMDHGDLILRGTQPGQVSPHPVQAQAGTAPAHLLQPIQGF